MERPAGVPGKVMSEEVVRYVSKTIKWSTPSSKGTTWRENTKIVIDIYTNVTNETEKYSNIRPSEVYDIKKKKNFQIGMF